MFQFAVQCPYGKMWKPPPTGAFRDGTFALGNLSRLARLIFHAKSSGQRAEIYRPSPGPWLKYRQNCCSAALLGHLKNTLAQFHAISQHDPVALTLSQEAHTDGKRLFFCPVWISRGMVLTRVDTHTDTVPAAFTHLYRFILFSARPKKLTWRPPGVSLDFPPTKGGKGRTQRTAGRWNIRRVGAGQHAHTTGTQHHTHTPHTHTHTHTRIAHGWPGVELTITSWWHL